MTRPGDPEYTASMAMESVGSVRVGDRKLSLWWASPFAWFDAPGLVLSVERWGRLTSQRRIVPMPKCVRGHRREIAPALRALAAVLVLCAVTALTSGCYVTAGSFSAGVAAASYQHAEIDSCPTDVGEGDLGDVELGEAGDVGEPPEGDTLAGTREWVTKMHRTWGTSTMEFIIDDRSEKGSLGSAGISTNMKDVIGEDSLEKIAAELRKGFVPITAAGDLLKRPKADEQTPVVAPVSPIAPTQ